MMIKLKNQIKRLKSKTQGFKPAVRLLSILLSASLLSLAAFPASAYAASNTEKKKSGIGEAISEAWGTLTGSVVKSKSDKTFTLMVYMIGSDLESSGGAASNDIAEMLEAKYSDKLNVVIQTGGSASWANPLIDANKTQRFVINKDSGGKLKEVGSLSKQTMNSPSTLSSFIKFAKGSYPADRYGLILWNHGGGTILGYGLDDFNRGKMMLISEIDQALSSAGVHFDFIGFDACMMGTLEVAFALSDHANYLIASEETEPSSGWYYPNWLTALSKNTGMGTVAIGQEIIKEFMHSPSYNKWDTYTLALIDMSKAKAVYGSLKEYFGYEATQVEANYSSISNARSSVKSFGDGQYEQVDLIDLLGKMQGGTAEQVAAQARSCVVYSDGNVNGSNGLAVYFPYVHTDKYQDISSMLSSVGYEQDYFSFFKGFMSSLLGGQQSAQASYAGSTASTPAGNTKGGLIDEEKQTHELAQ